MRCRTDRQPVEVNEGGGDVLPGLVRTLAAEFCTYWSLFKALLGIPDRTWFSSYV